MGNAFTVQVILIKIGPPGEIRGLSTSRRLCYDYLSPRLREFRTVMEGSAVEAIVCPGVGSRADLRTGSAIRGAVSGKIHR